MTTLLPNEVYYLVAQFARDFGPTSRAEIARGLAMSPSTVGRLVDTLIETRVLQETGQRQGNGAGRPSKSIEFNSHITSVLTIDLRLTHAYAAITDLAGNFFTRFNRPLTVGSSQQSMAELMQLIKDVLSCSTSVQTVGAIVIGAPSIVDTQTGMIEWAPSLDWKELPLKQMIFDEFGINALVENDVNLTALGEYWKGAGKYAYQNLVFVSVGTGIGAGIILNGDLYRGATNAAGEVGYFITDTNVLLHNAGQYGSLEARVGQQGLIRKAQLVAQRYPTSLLADYLNTQRERAHTREILALAERGDQAALVVFNELVDTLTIVICNIAVMIDPEVIIIGDPSDWNWDNLILAIQKRIGAALLRPIQLTPSQLGNDALIYGGAYTALKMCCAP